MLAAVLPPCALAQAPVAPAVSRKAEFVRIRPVDDDHQVVTMSSRSQDGASYCRRPCADCPWRKDAVGVFPPLAFKHSAETAFDMATHTFACHTAGSANTKICAGFLLRGADHNLTVRLRRMRGAIGNDVTDGGHELHPGYRSMAVANGVPADDPALAGCRSSYLEEQQGDGHR